MAGLLLWLKQTPQPAHPPTHKRESTQKRRRKQIDGREGGREGERNETKRNETKQNKNKNKNKEAIGDRAQNQEPESRGRSKLEAKRASTHNEGTT